MSTPVTVAGPPLPAARGPVSAAVLARLRGGPPVGTHPEPDPAAAGPARPRGAVPATPPDHQYRADPYGDDAQLALYCCYETHYRGFAGVPDELEWDPGLLAVRRRLEEEFLAALRAELEPGDDVAAEVAGLLVEPTGPGSETGVSHHLRRHGWRWQLREYVAHRSLYHLKEADPQAWVIPRLAGAAKAGVVSVEHDEYGGGRPDRMHERLFAEMMDELGLDPGYGAYLDHAPAATLAEVNFMSLCGLRRSLRGALIGQFAVVELTSPPGSERLARGLRRLGFGPRACAFYDEHVEADAVHEQVIRARVLEPLLAAEPHLAVDVVFGMRAAGLLGERFAESLLGHWAADRSSLRVPLAGPR